MKNQKPIFIMGCPRSGTTMLADLISNVTKTSIVESHFVTKYYKKLKAYGDLNKKNNFFNLTKDILNERPVMEWDILINLDSFFEEITPSEFSNIVEYISEKRAIKYNKENWGDKTPHYLLDLDIIHFLFPESYFIVLIRDGRDVALSLLEKKWGPNNLFMCAKEWKLYNSKHRHLIKDLSAKGKLIELRYEDILDNPANCLKTVFDFLNVNVNDNSVKEACSRINYNNSYKWKNQLSQKDINIFDSVAYDYLKKYGYEVSDHVEELNLLLKAIYYIHDRVRWASHFIYDNSINYFKIKYLGMQPFGD